MEIIALKKWFQQEKRLLPWRNSPTPYQVWISEVMLQQTQVATVITYFERWMKHLPSIQAVAEAPLEDIIKLWEGLGYYARARHIHTAAIYLRDHHNGELPSTRKELEKIKGLGPYTVGAILSFAFHQKAAAVDGNVSRVLARYYLIENPITHTKTQYQLRELAERLLPEEEPWIVTEALIELGAKICQKTPQCSICPIRPSCMGSLTEKAALLPTRAKKITYISLIKKATILIHNGEILLKKGNKGEVMADLYEFPMFEEGVKAALGLAASFIQNYPIVKYNYTRYRVTLIGSLWEVKKKKRVEGFSWISLDQANKLPFSSGHRRLFNLFNSTYFLTLIVLSLGYPSFFIKCFLNSL